MTTPYWIHCNSCAFLLVLKADLFILSCGHLLCKNCLTEIECGTKCVLCNRIVKYIEFKKISENHRARFRPDFRKGFREILKTENFQNTQQSRLTQITAGYKKKAMKAALLHNQLKDSFNKKKEYLEKFKQRRRAMQMRLKEIYTRQQKEMKIKKNTQREMFILRQQNSFLDTTNSSDVFSSNSKSNRYNDTSSSVSSFFDNHHSVSARLSNKRKSSNIEFDSKQSDMFTPRRCRSLSTLNNNHSQNYRTPLFS